MTWILLTPLLFLTLPHQGQLEESVTTYWNSLMKREKSAVLELVYPASRNDFILRQEPLFRSWRLVRIEPQLETGGTRSAAVTVSIEQMLTNAPGQFVNLEVQELWLWDGTSWKVRVKKPSLEAYHQIFKSPAKPSLPKTLQVTKQVRIHFLSKAQQGSIVVQNGLQEPVQLLHLDFDQEKFDLVERPEKVTPGKIGRITLEYKGDEIAKDLKSQVALTLKQGAEEHVFAIPVIYNYLSPGARGLFGLTEEKARKLKRGETPTPVLPVPKAKKPQEAPQP